MLVNARMIKDVAQLLVGRAGNPGSREVLGPTNLVLEPPTCLTPQTLNVSLLLIATQLGLCLVLLFLLRLPFLKGNHRHLNCLLACFG